ncbi:MAG: hypothetical protein IJU76_06950 [Desulfovibrionaceae bacterium]|nr:hypothetical protein [Desulfovibrionaceae bacterium]
MMYDVRLVKLVNGELVLGKYDAAKDCLNEVAILQVMPTQQGVQMILLPYGHPFESNFVASIESKHFLYQYSSTPKEIENKYIEAVSNITIAGGLGNLKFESQNISPSKLTL